MLFYHARAGENYTLLEIMEKVLTFTLNIV